jgi:hypothetical protein
MVLNFIKNRFKSGFPDLGLGAISEAVKASADIGGTYFENIKGINQHFRKTSPSLEISPESRCAFKDIVDDIKKKQCPVIAWVTMEDPVAPYRHAIVITDIDEDKLIIYLRGVGEENPGACPGGEFPHLTFYTVVVLPRCGDDDGDGRRSAHGPQPLLPLGVDSEVQEESAAGQSWREGQGDYPESC